MGYGGIRAQATRFSNELPALRQFTGAETGVGPASRHHLFSGPLRQNASRGCVNPLAKRGASSIRRASRMGSHSHPMPSRSLGRFRRSGMSEASDPPASGCWQRTRNSRSPGSAPPAISAPPCAARTRQDSWAGSRRNVLSGRDRFATCRPRHGGSRSAVPPNKAVGLHGRLGIPQRPLPGTPFPAD